MAAKATQPNQAKPKRPRGRPPALRKDGTPKYDIPAMAAAIRLYTNQCLEATKGFPILKECCILNDWEYDYVRQLAMEHAELSTAIKRLLDQKEICLEKLGACGLIHKSMAIFSLKQLGWTDKVDIDMTMERVAIIDDVPEAGDAQ